MKTLTLILGFSAAMIAINANASDEYLSPRAREQRGSLARGGTEVRQTLDFARGKAANASNSIVAGKTSDRDLVREQRAVLYSGKSGLGSAPRTFEIAPVK